jgi:hypothetical protein
VGLPGPEGPRGKAGPMGIMGATGVEGSSGLEVSGVGGGKGQAFSYGSGFRVSGDSSVEGS